MEPTSEPTISLKLRSWGGGSRILKREFHYGDTEIVIMYTNFSCLQLLMPPWRSHQVTSMIWYDHEA